jgi:hypothetical protein
MANYPNTLAPELQFLTPDMGLGERADTSLAALHERGFVAAVGLTEHHAGALAVISTQRHIAEYCPKDQTLSRFGTLESTRTWIGKDGGRGFVGIYDVVGNEGYPLHLYDVQNMSTTDVRMTADGWSGYGKNKHIPGADITTAYRVGQEGLDLARQRRKGPEDRFGLGMHLGELVIATGVNLYGADPATVSLETWQSNTGAVGLYERLGFELKAKAPDTRPTLKPIGTSIGDNAVYEAYEEGKTVRNVEDVRLFYLLGRSHPLVAAAA